MCAAASEHRYATHGEMFSGAQESNAPSSCLNSPNVPSVRRVRARGAIVFAVTPYFDHLARHHEAERGDAGLRGGVVRLTAVAEQSSLRGGEHDATVRRLSRTLGLLAPVRRRETGRHEVALEVNLDDRIPLLLGHVEDRAVAKDARVVDEDVEVAIGLERLLDEILAALPTRDVVVVGARLTAGRLDLIDRLLRGPVVGTRAIPFAAEVIDDDLGAFRGQEHRVRTTDPASGTGDDRDLSVKVSHRSSFRHGCSPASGRTRRCAASDILVCLRRRGGRGC